MTFLFEWVGPVSRTYRSLGAISFIVYLSHLLLFCVLCIIRCIQDFFVTVCGGTAYLEMKMMKV